MEEIEDKIQKCKIYIKSQEKYLLAMSNISKDYLKNQEMAIQCLQEILDINRNIQFLNNQINYLKVEKMILLREEENGIDESGKNNINGGSNNELPYTTYFDQLNIKGNSLTLRKFTEDSLTIDRISFKTQEIEFKKQSDQTYMEGFSKLLKVLGEGGGAGSNNRKDLEEASKKVENCQLRINLFDRALTRYIGLNAILGVEYKQDHLIWKNPSPRLPLTGKLTIKILSTKNLFKLKNDELYITVNIDNEFKYQSKSTKNERWNEFIELEVEKSSELELVIWGTKGGNNPLPIGLFWIPIREISECLRTSSYSSNFINNTNNIGNGSGSLGIKNSLKRLSYQGFNFDEEGEFIESWFTLEPIGQIELKLGFVKYDNKKNRVTTTEYSKLERQGVILKKITSPNPIEHNGHNFIIKQFYSPMSCALCNEFLISGTGFQCESCNFFCHKKCGPQVVFKCISKPSKEVDSETINHNIIHKFDLTSNLSANWCYHCGNLLPLGIKICKKCKSCGLMTHLECFHFVPDLCGLSMKEANSILHEIKLVKLKNRNKLKCLSGGDSGQAIDIINNLTEGFNNLNASIKQKSIEDYHLISVIGRGSFGKILLSQEKSTNNLFAIKILKKELFTQSNYLDSLKSEKLVLQSINQNSNPFLLGLNSCFQSDSRLYFVLDYIQGGDLMFHIQKELFSMEMVKFYAIEILLGLEHLHKNNIIYRDLKLDNILLGLDGHIKIVDFGLSKPNMKGDDITYSICGTPEFLAPEILLEQGYNKSVDWWSFGILLYEMRLGFEPFSGSDEDELYDSILDCEPDYPNYLERELVSLIQKLLIKDPTYRLGSGPEDANEIKKHIYFKGVNWDDYLNLRINPPFLPSISNDSDVKKFDSLFTNEEPILTPIDSMLADFYQNQFEGFEYTSSDN